MDNFFALPSARPSLKRNWTWMHAVLLGTELGFRSCCAGAAVSAKKREPQKFGLQLMGAGALLTVDYQNHHFCRFLRKSTI